jgi:alcohol dehydrogenase YqhD (iron-dependent ADH family)
MSIENFTVYNPTRLHFGKGVVQNIGTRVKIYGNRVLLMYGKGSVKKYGYYDTVVSKLKETGLEVVEFSGIKPNPVVDDVRRAVQKGVQNNIDVIVALGGGSVIDSAKITALSIANNEDPWNYMTWKANPRKTIPLVCVLTLAATGTEMNGAAVLQNQNSRQKLGYVNELNFPKESFLDPSFTTTVPADYTTYGIVDLIAHALESFFGAGEPSVTDKITTAIIKDAMEWAPALLNNLTDYDLRAKIMLDATLALNGITSYGKKSGDWGVHAIGHELSFLYDTPHGATLSIAYPAWLKLQKDRIPKRISTLGKLLFDTTDTDKTIELLQRFFVHINSPVSLKEIGIAGDKKEEIVNQMAKNNVTGMHHPLSANDYNLLVNFMLNG